MNKKFSCSVAVVMLSSVPLVGCGGTMATPAPANPAARINTASVATGTDFRTSPELARRVNQLTGVRDSVVVIRGNNAYVSLDLAKPIPGRASANDLRTANPDYTIRGAAGVPDRPAAVGNPAPITPGTATGSTVGMGSPSPAPAGAGAAAGTAGTVSGTAAAGAATVGNGIGNATTTIGRGLGTAASGVAGGVGAGAAGIGNAVGGPAASVGNGIYAGATGVGNGIGTAVAGVGNGIGNAVSSIGVGAGKAVSGVQGGAGGTAAGIGNGVGTAAAGVAGGIGSAIAGIGNGIGIAASGIGNAIGGPAAAAGRTTGNVVSGVGNGVGSTVSAVGNGVGTVFSAIGNGTGNVITGTANTVGNAVYGTGNLTGNTGAGTAYRPFRGRYFADHRGIVIHHAGSLYAPAVRSTNFTAAGLNPATTYDRVSVSPWLQQNVTIAIRNADPTIQNVYVSANPSAFTQFQSFRTTGAPFPNNFQTTMDRLFPRAR